MSLRCFLHKHDDLPAFHAGYLVLTVLAAALFNLGAFLLLILAHMSLDLVKYREVHGFPLWKTLEATFRESIADLMLAGLGLVFAVYFHSAAGIVTFGAFFRAEETLFKALSVFIPKLEILHRLLLIFLALRLHMLRVSQHLLGPWTRGEDLCLLLLFLAILLVTVAPLVLPLSETVFVEILQRELVPWRL